MPPWTNSSIRPCHDDTELEETDGECTDSLSCPSETSYLVESVQCGHMKQAGYPNRYARIRSGRSIRQAFSTDVASRKRSRPRLHKAREQESCCEVRTCHPVPTQDIKQWWFSSDQSMLVEAIRDHWRSRLDRRACCQESGQHAVLGFPNTTYIGRSGCHALLSSWRPDPRSARRECIGTEMTRPGHKLQAWQVKCQ